MAAANTDSATLNLVRTTGTAEKQFSISIGPRFLELFSENLYSSPNKAFEELIANSWDAEATAAYISIPDDLQAPDAAVWVLDNGVSMDADGLEILWRIASGHKREFLNSKRPPIGKFGIGKLATYILAAEITFVCKAQDGNIRTVSFNYREIEMLEGMWRPDEFPLTVRIVQEPDVQRILQTVPDGIKIQNLIDEGVPYQQPAYYPEEFHHPDPPEVEPSDTWTLVLLTSLRPTGQAMQRGRIRRMLRSALPLTSDFSIILNNEVLEPTKVEAETAHTWVLGRDLGVTEIDVDGPEADSAGLSCSVHSYNLPDYPYIQIDGIDGKISGQITLYKSRISGGKSDNLGSSNGFFVNVLGRIVNTEHPDFGLENLSHGTWSQFRATVRADGLDDFLGVEREGLRDSKQVRIFKRFLMATFNKARAALADSNLSEWPKAGDMLDGSWKSIPMRLLAEEVSNRLMFGRGLPNSFVNATPHDDETLREWNQTIKDNPGDLISSVKSEPFGTQTPFYQYDVRSRAFLVNENHPYFNGRSSTIEEKRVLQDFALTDFLGELYLMRSDIDSVELDEARLFRDEFLRLLSQLQRRTGPEIAQMLLEATTHPRGLEVIVGDALNYIGFNVTPKAGNGEPEGIAMSPLSANNDIPGSRYAFTFEAKSTNRSNGRIANQTARPGSLARHRDDFGADHTLLVAPDFELGALQIECRKHGVTPMRANDLAELLLVSAAAGTMDFVEFRDVFKIHDPDEVHHWTTDFVQRAAAKPHVPIGELLEIFEEIGVRGPDELETSVIADRIRTRRESETFPSEWHVRNAVSGLGVFLPAIVRINGKQVYLSAAPRDIRRALVEQLQRLPETIRFAIDTSI